MRPWLVPYKGEDRGIDAVCVLGEQIPPALLATAVDATVVGIVVVQPESFPGDDQLINETPYPSIVDSDLHPMPTVSECKGLAVIRALDLEKEEVQIITTIAEEEMERWEQEGLKVMLVRGRVELPVWEMVVRGREKEPVPWLEVGGRVAEGKGGAVWRVRRNVMRRGQQGGR